MKPAGDQRERLWRMTPEERAAILQDSSHELHELAVQMDKQYVNFRPYQPRRT